MIGKVLFLFQFLSKACETLNPVSKRGIATLMAHTVATQEHYYNAVQASNAAVDASVLLRQSICQVRMDNYFDNRFHTCYYWKPYDLLCCSLLNFVVDSNRFKLTVSSELHFIIMVLVWHYCDILFRYYHQWSHLFSSR